MNRIPNNLITLMAFFFSILGLMAQPWLAQAQVEENKPRELITDEDEKLPANIQDFEQEREEREEKLEETLNVEEPNPNDPKIEEVPDPNEENGLDDNLPYSPTDEETEIKF